jgi:hypothetical protein
VDALAVRTEARDRAVVFAEFGVPTDTAYRAMEIRSPVPGDVRARYSTIDGAGGTSIDDERPVQELPGKSWSRPYRVTVYGVDEEDYLLALATRLAVTGEPAPAPRQVMEIHPHGRRLVLAVFRATARYGDAPVYLDAHRHRDGTWTETIAGLEHRHTQQQIEAAWRGLQQLREVIRGKEIGDGIESAELFLQRCEDTALEMWRDDNTLVEDFDVFAGLLGRPSGRTAFYRRLGRYRAEGHQWAKGWPELRMYLQQFVLSGGDRTNRNKRLGQGP